MRPHIVDVYSCSIVTCVVVVLNVLNSICLFLCFNVDKPKMGVGANVLYFVLYYDECFSKK